MALSSFASKSSLTLGKLFSLSLIFSFLIFCLSLSSVTSAANTLIIGEPSEELTIHRDLFGQFSEHIGEGIYGGIWVGKDSAIENVNGIRTDVVNALKALKIPVIRWPGGCFADQYHWREGIGPREDRVSRLNAWGNIIETNQFGSHEFMEFIRQIDSKVYINVNLGSATVKDATDWLEYLTAAAPTSLAKERAENGHPEPYKVKYIGFGNEAWGCGGAMTAGEYFSRLKRYSTFALNLNPEQQFSGIDLLFDRGASNPHAMIKVAAGANDLDTEFTEKMMQLWAQAPGYLPIFDALSLHHYTMSRGPMSDSASEFEHSEYLRFVAMAQEMDTILKAHSAIMDKYDPERSVGLVVDEWGNWLKPDLATNPAFLKQNNTLRDAITAGVTLNIFARNAARVKMANIAQMVNVIQAMVLTQGEAMIVTPTYHLFKMYVPFQDAQLLPVDHKPGTINVGDKTIPTIDAMAARANDGSVWLALINIDSEHTLTVEPVLGTVAIKKAAGDVLTSAQVNDANSFKHPNRVNARQVSFAAKGSQPLKITLPPASVSVIQLSTKAIK
ncbi:alpha-N-arabinofuranosidase [Halioxenophilus aromaticivorans]